MEDRSKLIIDLPTAVCNSGSGRKQIELSTPAVHYDLNRLASSEIKGKIQSAMRP